VGGEIPLYLAKPHPEVKTSVLWEKTRFRGRQPESGRGEAKDSQSSTGMAAQGERLSSPNPRKGRDSRETEISVYGLSKGGVQL